MIVMHQTEFNIKSFFVFFTVSLRIWAVICRICSSLPTCLLCAVYQNLKKHTHTHIKRNSVHVRHSDFTPRSFLSHLAPRTLTSAVTTTSIFCIYVLLQTDQTTGTHSSETATTVKTVRSVKWSTKAISAALYGSYITSDLSKTEKKSRYKEKGELE